MTTLARTAVAPGRRPVVGHTLALWRDPLEFLASLPASGDLVEIRLGPKPAFVLCSPELADHVLHNSRTFDKGGPFFKQARLLVGDGLATCQHAQHLRQRRLLQPSFSEERLALYNGEMTEQLSATLRTWRDGQVIDVLATLDELAARVRARTLFAARLSPEQSASFVSNFATLATYGLPRALMPSLLTHVPVAINRRFEQALSTLDALTYEIIATYRSDGVDHGDLLSTLLAARYEDGTPLTDTEIRDQVLTFMTGGAELVASVLAWSVHLLGRHPEVAQRMRDEADEVLDGRVAVHADVERLSYTRRVLAETMRLYPPIWALTRVLTAEATLAGRTLPAGTVLLYSAYLIHRRPDLYPHPELFDPDRWLPDRAADLPRGAYIPFGAGTRKCIGHQLAMLEASIALSSIAARWRLESLPGVITRPQARFTLRPYPVRVRLHQRRPGHDHHPDRAGREPSSPA